MVAENSVVSGIFVPLFKNTQNIQFQQVSLERAEKRARSSSASPCCGTGGMLQMKRKMAITSQEDEYDTCVLVTLENSASATDSSYQKQG